MFTSCNDDDYTNIGSFILSCMYNRIDELSIEYNKSSQYSDFYNQYNDILKKLEKLLPPDAYELVKELDILYGDLTSDNQNYFYKQGFSDCKMMFILLHK